MTIDGGGSLRAVTCRSIHLCIAVGLGGTASGAEVTFDPASPQTAVRTPVSHYSDPLVAVSCPSDTQCTAIDPYFGELTFNPSSPTSNGTPTPIGDTSNNATLTAVACASDSRCVVTESNGDVVTFDPATPGNRLDGEHRRQRRRSWWRWPARRAPNAPP